MTDGPPRFRTNLLSGAVVGALVVLLVAAVWWSVAREAAPSAGRPAAGATGRASATPKRPAPSTSAAPASASSADGSAQAERLATGSATTFDTTPRPASLPEPVQVTCPQAPKTVSTAADLVKALEQVRPGDTIALADGVYTGKFVASVSGTADKPIFLCGGAGAILDGGDVKSGYAFHLDHASFWRLVGFTVRNAQKGVVLDASSHSVLQGLSVTSVGDEGIHLRSASSDNVVQGNTVSQTGLHSGKFGEGIYIGSATKNWGKYGVGGGPDRSDNNVIKGNHISATAAECVDIKEGTTGGLLEDNIFDGHGGLTAADSWVDVKGNGWTIQGNRGTTSPADGFQTHEVAKGWGTDNVFVGNDADVEGPGYGFHITNRQGNTVSCNNVVTAAGQGRSNVGCTAGSATHAGG